LIALQMLQIGDYFDPYLMGGPYYDKPLPPYWLITAIAWLTGGGLGPWSLRLSSVFYFIFWARVATADILTVGETVKLEAAKRAPLKERRMVTFRNRMLALYLPEGLLGQHAF